MGVCIFLRVFVRVIDLVQGKSLPRLECIFSVGILVFIGVKRMPCGAVGRAGSAGAERRLEGHGATLSSDLPPPDTAF